MDYSFSFCGKIVRFRLKFFNFILLIIFFFCGFSFLVYEITWLKLLSLIFGVTIYSITIILVCIMAGLALGSYFVGRIADNLKNPLNTFGLTTFALGLIGFITPYAFKQILLLYKVLNIYFKFSDFPMLSLIFRFILSFLTLIIPTTLIGATLPIIVKSSLFKPQNINKNISLLYSVNTLGSVIGCILTGFYFIGYFGVAISLKIGSILYFFTAIISFIIGNTALYKSENCETNKFSLVSLQDSNSIQDETTSTSSYRPSILKLLLIVYFISGMCAISYQLVWTRILILLSNSSVYSYTIILSVFLIGISAGSYIINFFINKKINFLNLFSFLEFLIGFSAMLPFLLIPFIEKLDIEKIKRGIDFANMAHKNQILIISSLGMMLLPTLFMGMTFPVAVKIYMAGSSKVSSKTGVIYSVNVLGCILGAIIGGFILIPLLGSGISLIILIMINFFLSLVLLIPNLKLIKVNLTFAGVFGLLILSIILNVKSIHSVIGKAISSMIFQGENIVWYKDGLENWVFITKNKNNQLSMFINRQHQANDLKSMVNYHRLIGHLPMTIHPKAKDILVIGLGGGTTSGAISQHSPTNIDCIELSKGVVEGAKFFQHINYNILNNPSFKLKIDDGRNYLLLTRKKYDLITADIIYPYHSGSGNLHSIEYFNLCKNALKEDGLMVQWIPLFIPEYHYKLIMRTFMNSFPHFTLWANGSLMIGSKKSIKLDLNKLSKVLKNDRVKKSLEDIGIKSKEDFLSLFYLDEKRIREYVGKGKIISDNNPYIEYYKTLPQK